MPTARAAHAGTISTGFELSILVTMGGWDQHLRALNQCWLFNVTSYNWQKVPPFVHVCILF